MQCVGQAVERVITQPLQPDHQDMKKPQPKNVIICFKYLVNPNGAEYQMIWPDRMS